MWYFISDKKSRDFFRFWFAQLISQFGDRVYQMALVGLMAIRHPGSVVEMAKLLAFTIIPVFIVGPIAGVYIDRWDRRTTLFICDFIRAVDIVRGILFGTFVRDLANVRGCVHDFFLKPFLCAGQNVLYPGDGP